jgi:hypothetical protein
MSRMAWAPCATALVCAALITSVGLILGTGTAQACAPAPSCWMKSSAAYLRSVCLGFSKQGQSLEQISTFVEKPNRVGEFGVVCRRLRVHLKAETSNPSRVGELVGFYGKADELCRGSPGDTEGLDTICGARDRAGRTLEQLGYCFGKKGQGRAEMKNVGPRGRGRLGTAKLSIDAALISFFPLLPRWWK